MASSWLLKINPIKAIVCGLIDLEDGAMILRNIGSIYTYLRRDMVQGFTVWQATWKPQILEGNFFTDQIKEDRVNAGTFTLGEINKTGNVRIMQHTGAWVQPLLYWKSDEYYTIRFCVFVDWDIQYTTHMRRIVICGLTCCTIFFHIFS